MDSIFKALVLPISVFLAIVLAGTCGYMHFNGLNLIDALQLVVVTISTCGLRQPATNSLYGKIFDISFIVVSFIVMISVISRTFSLILEGQIKGIQKRSKMRKVLDKIKDHYIVCGFGRVGAQVTEQLLLKKIPVVVIDSKPEMEESLQQLNIPYVIGQISSDIVLKKANIDHAKGLVACADSDVENVFVTLSAKTLNPSINIIARASDPANEEKMRRAGAAHVISPYLTTGQRISSIILNPSVAEFLDKVMHDNSLEVWFNEVKVPKNSKVIGKTLQALDIRRKSGIIVLAIKHANGRDNLNPDGSTVIALDDTLICLGSTEQMVSLKKML